MIPSPKSRLVISRPKVSNSSSLETRRLRSWSRSRDLVAKVLILVSRPGGSGLGLGLETKQLWSWSWSRDLRKSLDLEVPRLRSRPVILKTNYIYKKPRLWSLGLIKDL